MPATTVVQSNTGTTVHISTGIPETYDQAGYESTDIVFTKIGEIETLGPHGANRQIITFTDLETGTIRKMPGSKDYGNMEGTLGNIPLDAGQVIAKAAVETNTHKSVMVTKPDGVKHYLDVIVYKFEYAEGSANDPDKVNFGFAVCRAPVIVNPA